MTRNEFPGITRVVVIDHNGRAYDQWKLDKVEILIQDGGKTMKVFITKNKDEDKTV